MRRVVLLTALAYSALCSVVVFIEGEETPIDFQKMVRMVSQ